MFPGNNLLKDVKSHLVYIVNTEMSWDIYIIYEETTKCQQGA